jgi:hypothetical protein
MEQSPWEASWANQENFYMLWNPALHYRVHKNSYFSLSWATRIQSVFSNHISERYFLIHGGSLHCVMATFLWPKRWQSGKWNMLLHAWNKMSPLDGSICTGVHTHFVRQHHCAGHLVKYSTWDGTDVHVGWHRWCSPPPRMSTNRRQLWRR